MVALVVLFLAAVVLFLVAAIVLALVQSLGIVGAAVVIIGGWLALTYAAAVALDTAGRLRREYGAEVAWTVGVLVSLLVVSHVAGTLGRLLWLASVVVVAAHPGTRKMVLDWLEMRGHRRKWRRACAVAGLRADARWTHARKRRDRVQTQPEIHEPWLMRVAETPVGLMLRVHAVNWTHEDIAKRSVALAGFYDARAVQVAPDRDDVSKVTVTVVRGDPLEDPRPLAWPVHNCALRSLWEPVPLGIDEHGRWHTVTLPEHHGLIGGESGSGKSVAVTLLTTAAALDPNAELHIIDGKEVDLAAFEPVATSVAGANVEDAIAVLEQVRETMAERYAALRAAGLKKTPEGSPLVVVVIDELHFYSATSAKIDRDRFNGALRDLVARGRAAGIVVIAATQKPSADVVPTSLRDLLGVRLALRCTTNAASDTVLGSGAAGRGFDASLIPAEVRGVGWLHTDGREPVRLRCAMLTDAEVDEVVAAAVEMRGGAGLPIGRPAVADATSEQLDTEPLRGASQNGPFSAPDAIPRTRPRPAREAAQERVLAALRARHGEPAPQAAILADAGMDATSRTGRRALDELRQAGVVERVDGGWALRGGTSEDGPIPAASDDVPPAATPNVIPLFTADRRGGKPDASPDATPEGGTSAA